MAIAAHASLAHGRAKRDPTSGPRHSCATSIRSRRRAWTNQGRHPAHGGEAATALMKARHFAALHSSQPSACGHRSIASWGMRPPRRNTLESVLSTVPAHHCSVTEIRHSVSSLASNRPVADRPRKPGNPFAARSLGPARHRHAPLILPGISGLKGVHGRPKRRLRP